MAAPRQGRQRVSLQTRDANSSPAHLGNSPAVVLADLPRDRLAWGTWHETGGVCVVSRRVPRGLAAMVARHVLELHGTEAPVGRDAIVCSRDTCETAAAWLDEIHLATLTGTG